VVQWRRSPATGAGGGDVQRHDNCSQRLGWCPHAGQEAGQASSRGPGKVCAQRPKGRIQGEDVEAGQRPAAERAPAGIEGSSSYATCTLRWPKGKRASAQGSRARHLWAGFGSPGETVAFQHLQQAIIATLAAAAPDRPLFSTSATRSPTIASMPSTSQVRPRGSR